MKCLIGNIVEVCCCGSVAKDNMCVEVTVEVNRDIYIWDESEICPCLLLYYTVYLCKLVFVAPFFLPKETFRPFPFDFCLPDLALLLFAPRPFRPFAVVAVVLGAVVLLVMGVPFRRMLFGFIPSPLTFSEFAAFNLSSNDWMQRSISSVFLAVVSSTSPRRIGCKVVFFIP